MHYHHGTYDPAAAATAVASQQRPPPMPTAASITTYAPKDVLNGRGQGVQRHPGNVNYRALVSANRVLYAQCLRSDKIKISQMIVAAVRTHGGRFLVMEVRTGIYKDIGDKKATHKAGQALREGQTKIRKEIRRGGKVASCLLPGGGKREVTREWYLSYSVRKLESLCHTDQSPPAFCGGIAGSNMQQADAGALARANKHFPEPLPKGTCTSELTNMSAERYQLYSSQKLESLCHTDQLPPVFCGGVAGSNMQKANAGAFARPNEYFPGGTMPKPPSRGTCTSELAKMGVGSTFLEDGGGKSWSTQQANAGVLTRSNEYFRWATMPIPFPRGIRTSELAKMSVGSPSAERGDWKPWSTQQANADALARARCQFRGIAAPQPPSRETCTSELAKMSVGSPYVEHAGYKPRSTQQANADVLARASEQFPGMTAPQPPSRGTCTSELTYISIESKASPTQLLDRRDSDWDRWEEDAVENHVGGWLPVAFDGGFMQHDRVSELRHTDVAMNPSLPVARTNFQEVRNSLTDASLTSFSIGDAQSLEGGHRRPAATSESNEKEAADLLMRLRTS